MVLKNISGRIRLIKRYIRKAPARLKKVDTARLASYLFAAALVGLLLFFSYSRVFDEFEYSVLDFWYRARPPIAVDRDIVIIEVGDDSIEKIGKWPFPRKYHALLTRALKSAGAETIVFDIFFSEHKEGDEAFAEAIKEAGNVYVPYVFELAPSARGRTHVKATKFAAPLVEVIARVVKGSGFVNVEPDIDGKVRRVPLFIEYEGEYYPHLTFNVALDKLGYAFGDIDIEPGERITAGEDLVIPLYEDSSVLVNYPARWGRAFRHYSYVDILQSYLADVTGQKPAVNLKELAGTVCFIGLTATASPDAHPSPMEPIYPGIGVHTSLYNSIMKGLFLRRLGRGWNLLILVLMWIITGYVTLKSPRKIAILSIILIMAAYLLAAMICFWPFGVWVDVFYPLVTIAAIYVMVTLKKYFTEIQKRELIEKELDIAKGIQRSFLPREIPEAGGLDICARMLTARQVGGDLYDVVELPGGRIGVMLGDVSGKGVPAALYMARVVSVFKAFAKKGEPGEVVSQVNDNLVLEADSGLFVTMTYNVFDTSAGKISFAIGGHNPTILIDPDGRIELLDVEAGIPLGMMQSVFTQNSRQYAPGSIFVFYTDGVTEAMGPDDEMFGMERLTELASLLKGATAEEVVDAILAAVTDFEGPDRQHDDITVVAVRT
ncbi:MAG: CHASE2 domain-containing protein [Candidatus Omnitrophica bacterium]|nr:CHASE2 domain-containing protein [Candidatus Omnitrophota bacterium]